MDDVESNTSPLFSALSPPAVRVSRIAAAASEPLAFFEDKGGIPF